jgi:hypothetical protein
MIGRVFQNAATAQSVIDGDAMQEALTAALCA